MAWDSQENRQFAQTLADSYLAGYDPKAFEARKRYNDEKAWQDQLRMRQQEQWRREDDNRAAIQQLGYDAQNGEMVPGSDNSYDVAEGKRLGMNVPSTVQRTPLTPVDIERRMGGIALNAGDMAGYRQSLAQQRALEQEAADKAFGSDLQKIASGDIATLGKYAKEYNKDTTTPGMVTLINGQPHFVNPDTGTPQPVSFAQIAQFLGASHAMGRGDWKTGAAMMFQQQQYGDQRADMAKKQGLDERQVATGEKNASTNLLQVQNQGAYQQGMLGVAREKNAIDRMEAGAKASAANNLGKFGPARDVIGPDGQPSTIVPVMGRDGSISYQTMPLPEGYRLPKQVDPRLVDSMAARLEGMPTGRTINGKPETYTAETAYAAALSRLQGPAQGPATSPVAGDAAAIQKLLGAAAPAAPAKPAMAGRGAPRPQPATEKESPTARARREAYQRREGPGLGK